MDNVTNAMSIVSVAGNFSAPVTKPQRAQIRTRIYACGGTGMKNGMRFMQSVIKDGLSHVDICFLDTSDSDLPVGVDPSSLYLFKGIQGGGKDRTYAYKQVLPMIPEVLLQFPPADFNIVLHSGSGASGPSIGPALMAKLMENGHHAVVFQAGSTGSKKEVTNTAGSIKSYAKFASDFERPVLMYYRESNENKSRLEVDNDIQSALMLCCLLFSSENRGIDKKDLQNLIDYHTVTGFAPELSSFDFHTRSIDLPENLVLQTGAVLYHNDEDFTSITEASQDLEYRADGFMSPERSQQMASRLPIHFVVYSGDLKGHLQGLEERRNAFEARVRSRTNMVTSIAVAKSSKGAKGELVLD